MAKFDVVASSCDEPSEYEKNSVRERLDVTDSQISQLEYQIEVLEVTLSPVLSSENSKGEACGASPEPARSQVAQKAHIQGERIYRAHRRISDLLERVAI